MAAEDRMFVVSGVCCAAEETVLRKSLDRSLGPGSYAFSLVTGELAVCGGRKATRRSRRACARPASRHGVEGIPPATPEPWCRSHADALYAGAAALLIVAAMSCGAAGLHNNLLVHGILLLAIGDRRMENRSQSRARSSDRLAGYERPYVSRRYGGDCHREVVRRSNGHRALRRLVDARRLQQSRTRRAIQSLLNISPTEACVIRDGGEVDCACIGSRTRRSRHYSAGRYGSARRDDHWRECRRSTRQQLPVRQCRGRSGSGSRSMRDRSTGSAPCGFA